MKRVALMSKRANGEGSIAFYSSRNCYRGQLTIGVDESGKPKRKSFYGKTKKEVKEKMETYKLLNPINKAAINEYTVATWFNYWLWNIKKRDIKPKTFERYECIYRNYIKGSEIANIPLYKFKLNNLQAYYNRLSDNGKSPSIIKTINEKLKSSMIDAEKNGYIEKNYCQLVNLPKEKRKEKKIEVFSVDQQNDFLEIIKGHEFEILFLLAIGTGLRRGELLALRWSDIDFENKTINVDSNIQQAYIFEDEETKRLEKIEQEPKTINSFRTVPIPSKVLDKLQEHKQKQEQYKLAFQERYIDNDFVICDKYGKALDVKRPTRMFYSIQKKMGIPEDEKIKFHGLRKTYATRLFEKEVPPKTVQMLLGHSEISITLDIYTQVMENKKVEAIEKIDDIF